MPSNASKRAFNVVDVPFRMGGSENGRGVGERLAIHPNDNDILYFGSRSPGLWMSKDAALTWKKVDSFPAATAPAAPGDAAPGPRRGGGGAGGGRGRGAGLSFVVFDPSTGTRGKPTQVIYVGSTEPGTSHLFRGTDGGATFTNSYEVTGLPAVRSGGDRGGRGGGGGARVVAVGGREGDLWVVGEALCHSGDGGRTFREIPNHPPISARSSIIPMSFGKAAPGKDYPAIFVANQRGSDSAAAGIYRSDDKGATWVRINDAQHQWGNRFECLSGDPRIYGRVYVGTNGRGILYGDIAN